MYYVKIALLRHSYFRDSFWREPRKEVSWSVLVSGLEDETWLAEIYMRRQTYNYKHNGSLTGSEAPRLWTSVPEGNPVSTRTKCSTTRYLRAARCVTPGSISGRGSVCRVVRSASNTSLWSPYALNLRPSSRDKADTTLITIVSMATVSDKRTDC